MAEAERQALLEAHRGHNGHIPSSSGHGGSIHTWTQKTQRKDKWVNIPVESMNHPDFKNVIFGTLVFRCFLLWFIS